MGRLSLSVSRILPVYLLIAVPGMPLSAAPTSGSVAEATLTAQTITWAAIPSQLVTATLTLTATASSGLAVSYVSTTTSICTVSAAKATMVAAGNCTLEAKQAGNATYAAATTLTQSFAVDKKSQTITWAAIAAQTVTHTLTLAAKASSTLAVTYTSTTPAICAVSGVTASLHESGSCTIEANQAGNAHYLAAQMVSQSFEVNRETQALTFTPAAGSHAGPQTVTITEKYTGPAIYYTTNGTAPTTSSILYTGPIAVSESETIEALTTESSTVASTTATAKYTILKEPAVKLSITPNYGAIPLEVTASTAGTTDAYGTITSTSINFGDGTVVAGADKSHSYTTSGTYKVTATVRDSVNAVASASATVYAETPSACSPMTLGDNASLNGFVPFPADNAWNTDISAAPLDPNNDAITSAAGFAGLHLHHDFSSVAGGNYGIPYVVVDSNLTPPVSINVIDYADESDVARAPYPYGAPIEGSPADCDGWPDTYVGDSHVLVLDHKNCMLYETFNTHRCNGGWSASSETIWDLLNYDARPWGWTSADAAGLPIFPGLVRYDEVAAGAINHAIRFTMQATKNDANGGYFVEPATHAAGIYWGVSNVMGMRVRLKSSFDISGFSAANQVILTAMKKYGMILADNGGYFFFQGVPDPRWNDNDLVNLDAIPSSEFEVVQMTPEFPGYDSATAPTGAPPVINSFTASPATISAGGTATLNWNTSNDSYDYIDRIGGVREGSIITVSPTLTTTYTLNATNAYGRSAKSVTVNVTAPASK